MSELPRGPEILPGTWEYEWVSAVVDRAAERAGRPSNWNRRLYEEPSQVSGIYHTDGSMTVSRTHVLDPARPAYTPGHTPTNDERAAAGAATMMAVYQARLSLSSFGDDSVPGATPLGSLEDLALERALADRFTQRYGDRIAEDVGSKHDLHVGMGRPAFPAYTTATDRLMYPLAGATGMGVDELRDLIERTERPQRFNAIADRVIDHELGDLVPESHRAQLREDLSGPLKRGLGGLAMTELSQHAHPGSKLTWGDRSAEWTTAEFDTNLEDIKAHYESWRDEHPGTEPPMLPDSLRETFADRQEEIRQIWADAGWPAQRPVPGYEENARLPEQPYPSPREQENAVLQKWLWSHTAPSQQAATASEQADNVRPIGTAPRTRGHGIE
ncbi:MULTISPECIES: hypothetical protein [unclassified Kribbella]|uniref:hypothetical protein n=1 Tax=unclassified Kribbella TaxID=2644121 RepID=UPI0030190EF9